MREKLAGPTKPVRMLGGSRESRLRADDSGMSAALAHQASSVPRNWLGSVR